MVGRYPLMPGCAEHIRGGCGARAPRGIEGDRSGFTIGVNQGEEVATDTTRLGRDHALGRNDRDGGVDGIAATEQDVSTGFGRQKVWTDNCRLAQGTLRSGRRRFNASSTARTTARASSSSTIAAPISMRSVASVTRTIWATAM